VSKAQTLIPKSKFTTANQTKPNQTKPTIKINIKPTSQHLPWVSARLGGGAVLQTKNVIGQICTNTDCCLVAFCTGIVTNRSTVAVIVESDGARVELTKHADGSSREVRMNSDGTKTVCKVVVNEDG
jgi:hypothetical protein